MHTDDPQQFPLLPGSSEDFAQVETLLRNSGFDEPTILRTLKIEQMSDLGQVKPDELDLSAAPKVLGILTRLFLFTAPVRQREVEEVTDIDTTAAKCEERARGWLGSSQDQFDVVFALAE